MSDNLAGFRSFVLNKFPNIDRQQLQRLDKFVESKQLTPKEKETRDDLSNLESLAKQIKTKAESGKNVSGIGTGALAETISRTPILNLLGQGFTERIDELRSLASQLSAEISFGQAGKAFTETEKALLAGQTPVLDVRRDRPGIVGWLPGFEERGTTGAVLDDERRLVTKMNLLLDAIERKRKGETIEGFPDFTIEEIE
jgi:hypothetical protein